MFEAEDILDEIEHELSKCKVEGESQTNSNQECNFNMEIENDEASP